MTTPSIEAKYEVLGKLKEGGMGAIYKVRHTALDELRVVKVMRPQLEDDAEARRRFRNEAKMATSLRHPNIAALLDFTEDPGKSFYMVMEFIDGVTLLELLNRSGLPPLATALEIALQSLAALGYLHRRGIVHRDISPENLMVTRDADGHLLVKLIDLGVAKQTDAEGATKTGAFLGKLKYASPEQLGKLRADERLDGRSDLYSLGCVLYQILTGASPFEARSPQHYVLLHLSRPPRPFSETDPAGRVPAGLREAILRALAKNRKHRWQSADDFADALRAIQARLVASDGTQRPAQLPPGIDQAITESAPTLERTSEAEDVERVLRQSFTGPTPVPSSVSTAVQTTETGPDAPPTVALPTPPSAPAANDVRWRRLRVPGAVAALAALTGVIGVLRTGSPSASTAPAPGPPTAKSATALLTSAAAPSVATADEAAPRPSASSSGTGTLIVLASPWAGVDIRAAGDPVAEGHEPLTTPWRGELPAGRYVVRYRWSGTRSPVEKTVEIRAGARTEALGRRPGFDLDRAVADYAP